MKIGAQISFPKIHDYCIKNLTMILKKNLILVMLLLLLLG
jgi:hypothetical protein